jgi:ArsR family metal-binding transcriptional regulator
MLKMMSDISDIIVGKVNGRVGKITNMVGKMSHTINSYSQSIAKLETQVGQIANTFNRREEGKLPSQPMVNPKGHYMVNEDALHHQQV